MTSRPAWSTRARATSSVVVPILMKSEQSLGMSSAARRADALLLVGRQLAARLIGDVLDAGREQRAAMGAGQQALVAEVVEVLADGLRRHVEARGKFIDRDRPVWRAMRQDLVLAEIDGRMAIFGGRSSPVDLSLLRNRALER